MKPLRVGTSLWTKVFWGLVVGFFLVGAFYIWGSGGYSVLAIISLCIANVLALPFLLFGPIEMDEDTIRVTLTVGRFEIAWDEVQRIERSVYDAGFIVLHGEGKQLVIQGTNEWVGEDKNRMISLFHQQIETRGISVKQSAWADWQFSRGTRVKEF